jgi:hypothetical protein
MTINLSKKLLKLETITGDLSSQFNVLHIFHPLLIWEMKDVSNRAMISRIGKFLKLYQLSNLYSSIKFYKYLSQLVYELKDQKWIKVSKKPDVTQQLSYQEHNIVLSSDERVRAIGYGLSSTKSKIDYIEQNYQNFYKMIRALNIPNDLLKDLTNYTKYKESDFIYVDIDKVDSSIKYTRKWCCVL